MVLPAALLQGGKRSTAALRVDGKSRFQQLTRLTVMCEKSMCACSSNVDACAHACSCACMHTVHPHNVMGHSSISHALPPFPFHPLSISRLSPSSLRSAMRARAYVLLPPFHAERLLRPSLVFCHLNFLPAPPACAEQRNGRHPFAGFAREWTTLGVGGRCATCTRALRRLNRVVDGSHSARLLV